MNRTELQEYLSEFENENISVIIANPKDKVVYKIKDFFVITDQEQPVLVFEIDETVPFNDIQDAADE